MRDYLRGALSAAAIASMPLPIALAEDAFEPPPECEARVGYDRDRMMPGYLLPTSAGAKTCIPAFAKTVLQAKSAVTGARQWTTMKQLVATSSDVWEQSTPPTVVN